MTDSNDTYGEGLIPGGEPADHQQFDELATGWALHALEPDEEAEFERHLAGCARCTAAAAELTETIGDLSTLAPDEAPPARLRQRLLGAVAEDLAAAAGPAGSQPPAGRVPQQRAAQDPTPEPSSTGPVPQQRAPVPADPDHRETPADHRDGASPRHRAAEVVPIDRARRRWATRVLAAAAVVAIVALGSWNFALRNSRDDAQTKASRYDATLSRIVGTDSQVAMLMTPGGDRVGAVVARGNTVDVVAGAMPTNDTKNTTYVLWGLAKSGSTPQAVGTFDIKTGAVSVAPVRSVAMKPSQPTYAAYAVSFEHGRTAPAAPSSVMASGPIAS